MVKGLSLGAGIEFGRANMLCQISAGKGTRGADCSWPDELATNVTDSAAALAATAMLLVHLFWYREITYVASAIELLAYARRAERSRF